jgi:acyl-CoA reductase-like NAD-dependent aldehyde dehydrogenase
MNVTEIQIERLRSAQQRWRCEPVDRRLRLLRRLRATIANAAEKLAAASATARGRPMEEALMGEVLPLAEASRFLERKAARLLRTQRFNAWQRPLWLSGVRSEVRQEPLGVILIIGPGNYPLFLPGVQMIQALVAGNAVLMKPGLSGWAAAAALVECVRQAGFDENLIQLLPETVEAAMSAIEARPDKVIFTGSATVASSILARLGALLIPAVIEASGSDAVVVRADADLELTAAALGFALTFNGGATCMAPKRIFVHREVAGELVARLAGLKGRGVSFSEQEQRAIDLALATGAQKVSESPLLITGVPDESPLWQTAIFGPFSLISTFVDEAQVIARVNDCLFALGAAIFTQDTAAANRLESALDVGLVTINDIIISSADARLPFGGRRQSGFGVTRGAAGLLEMTATKTVTRSSGRFRPAYQPLTARELPWILRYLRFTHGMFTLL